MSDILTLSLTSSVIYFIFRFLEMKYLDKEDKPIKLLVKDSFFVFIGVYFASFLSDNLFKDISLPQSSDMKGGKTPAFVGNPDF